FTYTPADDFTGSDSFEYVVSDGAATVNGLVTLVVSNTAPDAQSDSYGTRVDQTLTVNAADGILANDSDDDGDSLTVSLIDGPDSGTLTLNGDGSFQYIPATGFLGRDQFRYQLNDGLADSVIRTARIGVFATSLESVDDSAVVSHDQSLSIPVQENDFNENAATVTVVLDSAPTNGTATVETDGTVTYVPNAGYTGSDAFRYHLDTGTATTATTTVSISVVNSTPVAFQRRFDGVHDAALSISAADGLLSDYRDDDGDAVTAA
ncbi:MAG: Ig-like domain-containing protein, partial [Boseongicola sp.]|nr:Ig-like domain-containing protein [Boseongicola sp.]